MVTTKVAKVAITREAWAATADKADAKADVGAEGEDVVAWAGARADVAAVATAADVATT